MTGQENLQEIVNHALKVASAEGEAVVQGREVLEHQIRVSNSEIDIFKQWKYTVLEAFVAIDGRIGTTEIYNPKKKTLDAELGRLTKFVRGLQPTPMFSGLQEEIQSPTKVDQLYDKGIRDFPSKAPDIIAAAVHRAQKAGAKRTAGSFFFDERHYLLETSQGFSGNYLTSSYRITLRSFVDAESSGQGVVVGRTLDKVEKQISQAGQESGEIAKLAQGGKQGKAGTYDLVLHPTIAASVLGSLAESANPILMMLGMSPLKDKIGEKLAPDSVSIWDDGRLPNGLASAPFDFEGTPTQKSPIFVEGTLQGVVHNASTARMLQTESTGNCQLVSFGMGSKLLVPAPTNVVFSEGDASFEELLEPQRPTIYVTSNWYLRYTNQLEGTFSTIPRDGMFLIEKGEISQPVQKLRISDNLLRIYANIEALGKSSRQVQWWEVETPTIIPFVRIKDVSMTAATQ
ncbi:MAG: TldD/PmbA family protein [Candidatus Thorarchaeota archaeon]